MSKETASAFIGGRDDALRVSMLLNQHGIAAELVEHSLKRGRTMTLVDRVFAPGSGTYTVLIRHEDLDAARELVAQAGAETTERRGEV